MQHLVVRSDRLLPTWAKDKYVLKLEMQCPVCGSASYQLWSPILEKEKSSTVNQMRWLAAYLEKACVRDGGAHPDWFLTPDNFNSA
jgi:hypothetical protein